MDRATNPFSPGAGNRPPELAGRDEILEQALLALARIKTGKSARSPLMIGLRGVGKTVLLVEIRKKAETAGCARWRNWEIIHSDPERSHRCSG